MVLARSVAKPRSDTCNNGLGATIRELRHLRKTA
jgi:hypothetical protein